jgi:ABC-2 type transport system permease protein
VTATLRKFAAIFSIYLKDGIAYRVNGIIWILTDAITVFTMPLVWMSAVGNGSVEQFTKRDITQYYLMMLMVSAFVICHFMWELAMEIKEGQFAAALVKPISVYQVYFLRNFSWRFVRMSLSVPFLIVFILIFGDTLRGAEFHLGWTFLVTLFLGHLLSFTTVMMLGFLALFIEEAFALFELYYFPMLFLSGQIIPVAMLPGWAQSIAKYLPFYYTTNLPVDVAIGRVSSANSLPLIGVQIFFVALTYGASKLLWAKGLKQFTGVGL